MAAVTERNLGVIDGRVQIFCIAVDVAWTQGSHLKLVLGALSVSLREI